jgi:hypothetical protein
MIEQFSPFDGSSIYRRPVLRDTRMFHKRGIRPTRGNKNCSALLPAPRIMAASGWRRSTAYMSG